MGKLSIKSFFVHSDDDADMSAVADRISDLHMEIIERRLRSSGLSAKQQIEIIVRVIQKLKTTVITEKAQDAHADSYKPDF